MYTVTVRDHMMIAHSFKGEVFGPAQRLHGATYVVDVEFRRPELDADGIVVDIGRAGDTLQAAARRDRTTATSTRCRPLRGRNTTTEFLARLVFDGIVAAIGAGELGLVLAPWSALKVTLHESHVASASFEGRVRAAA